MNELNSIPSIAREAANLIRKFGINKQSWGSFESGFCVLGAVRMALFDDVKLSFTDPAGKHPHSWGSIKRLDQFKQFLIAIWKTMPESERKKATWPDDPPAFSLDHVRPICRWNDHPDRTIQDILVVLDSIGQCEGNQNA